MASPTLVDNMLVALFNISLFTSFPKTFPSANQTLQDAFGAPPPAAQTYSGSQLNRAHRPLVNQKESPALVVGHGVVFALDAFGSFLLLVAMPGATSSVPLVAMPFVPSSFMFCQSLLLGL